jgi:hypothetical protein
MSMTKGEYRVGIDFNPSADDMVGQIKRAAADLIDMIEAIPVPKPDSVEGLGKAAAANQRAAEVIRLKYVSQEAIEDAAMWAVKAVTKPEPK